MENYNIEVDSVVDALAGLRYIVRPLTKLIPTVRNEEAVKEAIQEFAADDDVRAFASIMGVYQGELFVPIQDGGQPEEAPCAPPPNAADRYVLRWATFYDKTTSKSSAGSEAYPSMDDAIKEIGRRGLDVDEYQLTLETGQGTSKVLAGEYLPE